MREAVLAENTELKQEKENGRLLIEMVSNDSSLDDISPGLVHLFKTYFENDRSWCLQNSLSKERRKILLVLNSMYLKFGEACVHDIFMIDDEIMWNSLLRILAIEVAGNEDFVEGLFILCRGFLRQKNTTASYDIICESLHNAVKPIILQLVTSDRTIFQSFIFHLLTHMNFSKAIQSPSTETNKSICCYLLKTYPALSTESFLDDVAQYVHLYIVNNVQAKHSRAAAFEILSTVDTLCYDSGNLVTCVNIDKISQDLLALGDITVSDYIKGILLHKENNWIENSVFTLECNIFPEIEPFFHSTIDGEVPWSELNDYLFFYSSLLSHLQKPLNVTALKPLFDVIRVILKLNAVPSDFNLSIKSSICIILKHAYQFDITPSDHGECFLVVLSYLTFSPMHELRNLSKDTLITMINWNENVFMDILEVSPKKPHVFLQECEKCFTKYANGEDYLLIMQYLYVNLQSASSAFRFDELFSVFHAFEDLNLIEHYRIVLSTYPKKLRKRLLETLQSTHLVWKNISFSLYCGKVLSGNAITKKVREMATPLYPEPSIKEVRIYLYTLWLCRKNKNILNRRIDTMMFDMFRYDNPDIVSYFVDCFESLKPEIFLTEGLINCLSNQNCTLVSIVKKSQNLRHVIAESPKKFEIIKACIAGKTEITTQFIKLLYLIQNGNLLDITVINEKGITAKSKINPYYMLLNVLEKTYINWQPNDRVSFWNSFAACSFNAGEASIIQSAYDGLQLFFKNLEEDNSYVYVDRRMVIHLTKREIESRRFHHVLSEKIKEYKNSQELKKTFQKVDSKASTKGRKKEKTDMGEHEILKTKDIEIEDSGETLHVTISIYPNGKKGEDNEEIITRSHKKLTSTERKHLFLEEAAIKDSDKLIRNNANIIKYSDHITKLITNDLFKGFIGGNLSIGKLIGALFHLKLDFGSVEEDKLLKMLEQARIGSDKLANILFIKLLMYLQNRGISSKRLEVQLKKVENKLHSG